MVNILRPTKMHMQAIKELKIWLKRLFPKQRPGFLAG
jgi:hypothetical protein